MAFWHELALELGCSVRDAQEKIDSAEFTRWKAFNEIDPIGHKRADRMLAEVCATIMRSVGVRCEWEHFKPRFDEREIPIRDKIAVALSGFEVS